MQAQNRSAPYFIGMSMGGTKLYAALYKRGTEGKPVSLTSRSVIWRDAFGLDDPRDVADPEKVSSDAIVERIVGTVRDILAAHGLTIADLNNVGCTSPGPLDREKGIIGSACKTFNLPFDNYPFVQRLREKLGATHVEIKHDSHSGLEGEVVIGALSDVSCGYYIIQGTGLGGSASKDRVYYEAIPELTEPGHHIIGTPIMGKKYRYRFRYIMKRGKDHPYEVVPVPDRKKSYHINESAAREMLARSDERKEDLIWAIEGERDFEDIVAGVALEPMLKDKERLAEQFGGALNDFSTLAEPKDLSELALKGDPNERRISQRIIRYIGEEMGKALAALIAASYGTEWQLQRVVVGSAVGEKLGLGVKAEGGEDFYFYHIRESARSELAGHFGLPDDFSRAVSREIVRSGLTQEVRETAGFDRP